MTISQSKRKRLSLTKVEATSPAQLPKRQKHKNIISFVFKFFKGLWQFNYERTIIMLNNTDFDIFITESISDAHIRLRNKDEAYKEKCTRKANIHEILENTISTRTLISKSAIGICWRSIWIWNRFFYNSAYSNIFSSNIWMYMLVTQFWIFKRIN